MNSEGHLIDISEKSFEELQLLKKQGYQPIPNHLSRAAQIKLNGEPEAQVSLTSGGQLSKHAAKMRKKKRKMQKKSRRNNR